MVERSSAWSPGSESEGPLLARKLAFDRLLFTTVLLLVGLGLVMVYSASAIMAHSKGWEWNSLFLKQAVAALIGLGGMFLAMHVDYRILSRPVVVYSLLAGVMVLLIAVLFAPELNNARQWLFIGGVSVQPSELAKLVLVPFVAYQIERKAERVNHYAFLVPCGVVTALMGGLILLGRDLGTAIMMTIPVVVMIFLAGLSWRYLLLAASVLTPIMLVAIFLESYRRMRIFTFLDPEKDPLGSGFQLLQSLIAIGSGGFLGLGPGNSMQKLYFLPSPHADFVFSITAEELGFLGASLVVALFGALLWRGAQAGLAAPDAFGRYLAWGFTCLLVVQAMLNMSVALGLVPTTGIPLPLISHGGSSLVTTMTACGLILNVSQHG